MAAAESLRAKSLTSLEAVRNALRSNEIGESQDDLAFDAAEHAKCEELLEAVSLLPNSARAGAHRELWARWDQLRRLSLRLDEALRAAGLGDPERSRRLRATIARVSRRRWQRLGRLRHLDPASVSELVGAPRVAALVSDLESPGRVFLHLIFRQGELEGVWARISGDEAVCGRVAFPLFDLGRAIKVVNGWIVAPTPVESRLRLSNVLALLSDTVGRPLEKAILPSGCQHLVISGAWFLDLIPWHCVSVGAGGRMLMDVYGVVSSCPSLRFLRHVKRPPLTASARVTGIAFSPTESPIPGACREVEHLVRQHPGADVFTQKAATIDRVLRSGAQSCILHVACHGSWIPEDPRSSFLWCAPRGDDGGRLRLSRLLAEADFARELELAVLSACHSGTSVQRERTVQEYTGLDVGFLARGARSTISSLWEVDDLVSVLLMARLHELLREGVAIDAALMRAMREWRDGPLLELAENRNRDGALDQLMPGWRDNAAKLVAKASHPHWWGPFRCCGWTWRSIAGIANTQPSGPSSTAPP
jgi:CHAT domain-containing protein